MASVVAEWLKASKGSNSPKVRDMDRRYTETTTSVGSNPANTSFINI